MKYLEEEGEKGKNIYIYIREDKNKEMCGWEKESR